VKSVVIIGASGHGKVVADIVRSAGDNFIGFLDGDSSIPGTLGLDTDFEKFPEAEFVIAIGNSHIREKIADRMPKVKWYTAIHPSAIISDSVHIGEGSVVMPGAVINADAKIGRHSIINTTAVVEHDNVIGDFSHISVGTKLGGTVIIGNHCWVGINATVNNNTSVCDDSIIGAGAVVVKSIEEPGTYVGVPARKIK